jgi:hypothetical protein
VTGEAGTVGGSLVGVLIPVVLQTFIDQVGILNQYTQ